jgi:hypothetical protein|eukprot:COSAG06_NODE_7711_length_2402_cov_19.420756_1_plen_143_part_00
MGQAPAEVQALLREHTTTHQVNELHYLKKLPGTTSGDGGSPVIVFLNGAGERGPADGSELDRACMHGPLKVALAGPSDSPGLPGTLLDGFIILNPQLCAAPCLPPCVSERAHAGWQRGSLSCRACCAGTSRAPSAGRTTCTA